MSIILFYLIDIVYSPEEVSVVSTKTLYIKLTPFEIIYFFYISCESP